MQHRNIEQHTLSVCELLDSWQRGDDALLFLRHAVDTVQTKKLFSSARGRKRNRVHIVDSTSLSVDERLQ